MTTLLTTTAIYLLTPWDMTQLESLIWFVLIFSFITTWSTMIRQIALDVKRRRKHTRKYDYELWEELPNGNLRAVEGSRQR